MVALAFLSGLYIGGDRYHRPLLQVGRFSGMGVAGSFGGCGGTVLGDAMHLL